MKNLTFLVIVATLILSCNQTAQQTHDTVSADDQAAETPTNEAATPGLSGSFHIENIPFSDADLGDFPFFTLPRGLQEQNKPLQRNFDVCYFPVDGMMTPFEGKLYKTNVTAEPGEDFSKRYFEKSMEDYLQSIGAVKIYDGEITREEYDRYNKQDPNKGDEGDMGYPDQAIRFYIIRSQAKGNIYIQFTANNAAGKLNILQEEVFQQTMTRITADDIIKDLTEKGKSVLYINFDTDKSHITSDGKEVVDQISEALKTESALKSEENKAKNRRVELIRVD